MRVVLIVVMVVSMCTELHAASLDEGADPLSAYVKIGLQNNLSLLQRENAHSQAVLSVDEAKGRFLPSIGLYARYSRAGGGRTIEFPIGDLLNPVYGTLNQLLAAHGQQGNFPTDLQNEEIAFLREEEQETKIQLIQPLFQPALHYNYRLKKVLEDIERFGLSAFQQDLVADIKTSYFTWCKTVSLVSLLETTRIVVEEHVRISESLVENGKATADVSYRAHAELSAVDQQIVEAKKDRDLARSYFNFLLNRPQEEYIEMIDVNQLTQSHGPLDEGLIFASLVQRDEVNQARLAIEAAKQAMKLQRSSYLPGMGGAIDYGFQGEQYRFSDKDDFWMASLVLQWNLFNGFRDKKSVDRAAAEVHRRELALVEIEQQLRLQLEEASRERDVKLAAIHSSEERVRSMRASFDIVEKKYRNGSAAQFEFLDARAAKTNAETALIIARYDYQIALVLCDRASGWKGNVVEQ